MRTVYRHPVRGGDDVYLCVDAGALNGVSKDELLSSDIYSPVAGHFQERPLAPEIGSIARGEYKTKQPPAIIGTVATDPTLRVPSLHV